MRLTKEATIFLYGNNLNSEVLAERLASVGFQIHGKIDSKAHSFQQGTVKLYTPNEFMLLDEKETSIVIVCLRNALEQEKVAKELYRGGVQYILYLPMQEGGNLENRHKLRMAYQMLFRGEFENIELPEYQEENNQRGLCNKNIIINEYFDSIVFYCPNEYLHVATTDIMEEQTSNRKVAKLLYKYADTKLEKFTPYLELFDYLSGKSLQKPYMYLQARRETIEEQDKLLSDRKKLYDIYEKSFVYEQQFFNDSPVNCRWNRNGYFNVVDGLHRAHYLISKGCRSIPIIVSKEDYENYCDLLSF